MSLPDEDVVFLDVYADTHGIGSRSAALHKAVVVLRQSHLATAYEDAWQDWRAGGDAAAWESSVGDGMDGP